uniref:Uncharacterized protein n=1 Tax=Arundo donax TaxID=35708 RepID=A0A0A9CH07_ARUDO
MRTMINQRNEKMHSRAIKTTISP